MSHNIIADNQACGDQYEACKELLQSSLPRNDPSLYDILPKQHGFVQTVLEAYNKHRSLIIRPDDVWLAILVQFNFFVNGNAELLRKHFVSHDGKRELGISAVGGRYSIDFGAISRQMTELMEENIVDPSLRDWIMPQFSTTTLTDTTTYAMVMMATMKEYFDYGIYLMCGIPRVTLEGEKQDWENILTRLERLKEFGVQTIAWYHMLRPIITRFIAAYDNPDGQENRKFWSKVAHYESFGSGPPTLSGWITAFCVFNEEGAWRGTVFKDDPEQGVDQSRDNLKSTNPESLSPSQFAAMYTLKYNRDDRLKLDGFPYPSIDSDRIPPGYAHVDVKLDDNGQTFDTAFVAGSIGSQILSNGRKTRDSVQPVTAWWYFIKN
ncbi:hypothetical protein SERLADRAFT_373126 [Serpula lacrymans var. lacrymans S7.9]|uniref:Uncharacterized protein n=1 Tax=Serpula lacrymans var. lacrymans (strain S7.9) TaxID=578457 RepID=F8P7B0_SERL9|nr:uncharacterized protein SERLADRAFT_373126 [Serpula lacrymans var. lacrymans S7.9]EGO21326.1 hypothetical protein SERLADRAFT_373126 [Serpula lacrymans var. lacrymans S7.9]